MEHPVKDIRGVVRSLCQGTPDEQQDAVNRYYLPSASFAHPLCRVPSFENVRLPVVGEVNSRQLVLAIYKWYKILSPKIDIEIESSVFDQRANLLYITANQTFSLWFVPFHRAPVRLVTVLHLVTDSPSPSPSPSSSHNHRSDHGNVNVNVNGTTTTGSNTALGDADDEPSFAEVTSTEVNTAGAADKAKERRSMIDNAAQESRSSSTLASGRRYRIKRQEDLYQVNELLKFVLLAPGAAVCGWLQMLGALLCLVGVVLLGPAVRLVRSASGGGGIVGRDRGRRAVAGGNSGANAGANGNRARVML